MSIKPSFIRQSLAPIFLPWCFSRKEKHIKHDGKSFWTLFNSEHSRTKFFVMNPWIVFKNTDFCNLKLIATLSVYVLLHVSQRILKCACHLLLPLAETTAKKYFYSKAVSRFKKTGQFCRKCLTTRSKKAKGKMYRSAVQSSTINVTWEVFFFVYIRRTFNL